MFKVVLDAGHHTLCPGQPGCPVQTSESSVAGSCPPYLYLGLRGRASLPDVHRKQGWGWAGQGREENGGLSREAVQDSRFFPIVPLRSPQHQVRDLQEGQLELSLNLMIITAIITTALT